MSQGMRVTCCALCACQQGAQPAIRVCVSPVLHYALEPLLVQQQPHGQFMKQSGRHDHTLPQTPLAPETAVVVHVYACMCMLRACILCRLLLRAAGGPRCRALLGPIGQELAEALHQGGRVRDPGPLTLCVAARGGSVSRQGARTDAGCPPTPSWILRQHQHWHLSAMAETSPST